MITLAILIIARSRIYFRAAVVNAPECRSEYPAKSALLEGGGQRLSK